MSVKGRFLLDSIWSVLFYFLKMAYKEYIIQHLFAAEHFWVTQTSCYIYLVITKVFL